MRLIQGGSGKITMMMATPVLVCIASTLSNDTFAARTYLGPLAH